MQFPLQLLMVPGKAQLNFTAYWFPFQPSEEEAALVAGITGYKVEEGEVTDPETNNSFPIVKAVQGWGMLMRPDAAFRKPSSPSSEI